MSMIEQGRNYPTARIISQLMTIFGISADVLFADRSGKIHVDSSAGPHNTRRIDYDDTRILPSIAILIEKIIASCLALEDLAGAQKHAAIPLHIPLELSEQGLQTLCETVRQYMHIHDGVVFDYYELFESFGLRVIVLPLRLSFFGACYHDAHNENAFFIINNRHNPEKQLFTLANQLGALYLQNWAERKNGYPKTDPVARLDIKHAAAKFAAHFLMPANAVRTTVAQLGIQPDQWTYELLLRIKHRFGISAEAFLYRLDDLHLITPRLKQTLKTIIKNHYKQTNYREPDDTRRILTPNGRLWDLVLAATLHHGEKHPELNQIKNELKRIRIVKI